MDVEVDGVEADVWFTIRVSLFPLQGRTSRRDRKIENGAYNFPMIDKL